jgi:cysteine desulfurase / selenocysteine lyase
MNVRDRLYPEIRIEQIRALFPCFAAPEWEGAHYLDSAATTQKPAQVIDAVWRSMAVGTAPVHRGLYPLAEQATQAYERARGTLAGFVGARSAKEIVFCASATDAIDVVATGWASPRVGMGDEICVTRMEHHSNLLPWQRLCRTRGARLRFIEITQDGRLDLASARLCINSRTRLVALCHVSNVLGTVNRVSELAAMAHEQGAQVLVDAAQSIGHLPIDVQQLGCDFLAFSGHKMYGPSGIGVLWGRRALLEDMEPALLGGGMVASVAEHSAQWRDAPYRFEAGSPNLAGAAGLEAAARMLSALPPMSLYRHLVKLSEYMRDRLRWLPGVTLYGPADPTERLGITSFQLAGIHPHDVAAACGDLKVCVRAGNHCCQLLLERLGAPGNVRASLAIYSTRDDVDALVSALDYARRQMQ